MCWREVSPRRSKSRPPGSRWKSNVERSWVTGARLALHPTWAWSGSLLWGQTISRLELAVVPGCVYLQFPRVLFPMTQHHDVLRTGWKPGRWGEISVEEARWEIANRGMGRYTHSLIQMLSEKLPFGLPIWVTVRSCSSAGGIPGIGC